MLEKTKIICEIMIPHISIDLLETFQKSQNH